MKAEVFEVSFTGDHGHEVVEVTGREPANARAKLLAKETGKRTIVRKKPPPRNWAVIVADLETGEASRINSVLTGPEATILFQKINRRARANQAVAIFWPTWAPDMKITFEQG